MECNVINCLPYPDHDNDFKIDSSKNLSRGSESLSEECARADTPSSDDSTSGVCSMASSDFEGCSDDKQLEQERELEIKYLNRDILDLYNNLHPYGLFQTTSVPKMNMSNFWERRSIYHRLGPYGTLHEFDREKCYDCDFYTVIPKK